MELGLLTRTCPSNNIDSPHFHSIHRQTPFDDALWVTRHLLSTHFSPPTSLVETLQTDQGAFVFYQTKAATPVDRRSPSLETADTLLRLIIFCRSSNIVYSTSS